MYAQLCKRLSEEAPNFEPVPSPCTFRLLLLNKCRAEFENRSKAFEAFERDGPLAPEEEERRQLAKRKMLGNIKFIGELCKLEILAEGILHSCIQQLLQKKSGCSVRDRAEDLECLCQIMKTCGRILDSDKGQKLMDQYFQRMAVLADNQELPLRFRFMLRDAVELRQNKWVPRKATSTEGPMPINLIHDEDPRGRGVKFQLGSGGVPGGGSIMYGHPLKRGDVGDLLSSYPLSSSSFPIPSPNDKFSFGGNGYPSVYGRQRQRQEQNFYSGGGGRQNFNQNHKQNHNSNSQQQQQNFNNSSSKDLPPRFKNRMLLTSSQGQSPEEVSLRPAANSLSNQVNSKPPMGLNSGRPMGLMSDPLMAPPSLKTSSPLLHKEQILIKQASLDRSKSGKKDKGPTKDEVLKKIESLMEEYSKTSNVKEALSAYREQKIPDRFVSQVLLTMMVQTLDKNDSVRELAGNLIVELKKETLITSAQFLEAFNELVGQMSEKEKEIPRIYSYVAGFAAHAVSNELASLAEFSDVTENGAHFPLFMLILQQLHKTQGKAKLTQIFNDSKVNLLNMLPEVDRTKDRLSEILEERGLSFLFPLLRIQSELWKQLQADPNPTTFYKWIRDNLEPSHHTDPGFINALMTVLLQYITQESIGTEAPGAVPDKQLLEKEKGLLEKFKLVLQAFLHDHLKLQVIAVYSLQVYCFSQQFPKGMLLRWFVNLYDLEIIEEEAFLQWKEDLNEEYPGKGKALFQVNQWLTWLAEAESEEEEEGED